MALVADHYGEIIIAPFEFSDATAALADVLPKIPAGILLGIPGIGVLTASAYGAAIGDPQRYRDAAAAYRAFGLVPFSYESAGRARTRTGISHEGSVELRRAIVDLGRVVGLPTPLHHLPAPTDRPRQTAPGGPDRGRAPRAPARVRHAAQPTPLRRRPLGGRRHRPPPPPDEPASHGDTAASGPPERRDLPAESTVHPCGGFKQLTHRSPLQGCGTVAGGTRVAQRRPLHRLTTVPITRIWGVDPRAQLVRRPYCPS